MNNDNSNFDRSPKWEDLAESTRKYVWWNVKFLKHLPKLQIILLGVMVILFVLMLVTINYSNNEMAQMSLQDSRARGVDKVAHQLRMFRIKAGRYPESLGELVPTYLKSLPVDVQDGSINFLYARSKDGKRFHLGTELQTTSHPLTYDSDFNSLTADYFNGFDGADPVYDHEDGR